MKKDFISIAIDCKDRKLSALFFDKVISLTNESSLPQEIRFQHKGMELVNPSMMEACQEYLNQQGLSPDQIQAAESVYNVHASHIQYQLSEKGFSSTPFYRDSDIFGKNHFQGKEDTVEFKLVNIGVIDDSLLEWRQVLEIRNDTDSIAKLRRFRLFLTKNYSDKSGSYIRDDLLNKIYDYEQTCKKHGLTLTLSTISKILSSNSLLGALGLSAAGILTESAAVITAGIVGGVVVEIGKTTLYIAEKKLEIKSIKSMSEIAYLMEIREKTANKALQLTAGSAVRF